MEGLAAPDSNEEISLPANTRLTGKFALGQTNPVARLSEVVF